MAAGIYNGADEVVAAGGTKPGLPFLVLFTASGTATLTGYFVDDLGLQIVTGSDYSYSLTITTTPTTLYELLTAAVKTYPTSAVRFKGVLSADIRYVQAATTRVSKRARTTPVALATEIASNAARYGTIPADTDIRLGGV